MIETFTALAGGRGRRTYQCELKEEREELEQLFPRVPHRIAYRWRDDGKVEVWSEAPDPGALPEALPGDVAARTSAELAAMSPGEVRTHAAKLGIEGVDRRTPRADLIGRVLARQAELAAQAKQLTKEPAPA